MKEFSLFALRLTSFLLIFFCVDYVAGKLVRHLYFSQKIKYTYGIEQTKADIIVVGSSRAENHYVPFIFNDSLGMSCFNMGSGGQNIYYDYGIIKSILDRYTPKIFIIDLMDIDISMTDDTYNTDRLNILLPYYKNHEPIKEVIALRGPVERIKLLSQIYPFNSQIISIIYSYIKKDNNVHFTNNGYISLEGKIKTQPHITEKVHTAKNKIDPLKIKYLEKLISNCKSKNVRLIMITSPWYNKLTVSQLSSSKVLQDIAEKNEIEFWDYSQNPDFLLNDTMFIDIGHLNHQGASLFTKLIIKRIKNSSIN